MPYKDLHDDPFDEGTKVKLEIFEDYAQAWLPTFVMQGTPVISIFDFFAGTGYDMNRIPGTPIRLLQKIQEQTDEILRRNLKVKLHLNEFQPGKQEQKKFALLKSACEEFLQMNPRLAKAVEVSYYNEDFEQLFPKLLPEVQKHPALVYLDQNGVKFLSDKYLLPLEKVSRVDFLYFISSSYILRFGNTKEFKDHLDIDIEAAKKQPYNLIHRTVINHLRSRLPKNTKLMLYPFSIKKGKNIYGIVFGASHPRAVDKFLGLTWKRNATNGEANFDIDNEAVNTTMTLFGRGLSKIESFQLRLKEKILSGIISNNKEALIYAYAEGHLPTHAAETLKTMKKNGELAHEGSSPLVTYDNVYKAQRIISYQILKR